MRLLNRSLIYLSVPLLLILSIWSVVLYFNMLDEISDSIDDGLNNSKLLIIQRAASDSLILHKSDFNESNYAIQEITKTQALIIRDRYTDTTMYMQHELDMEPVRMLSSAFERNGKFYSLKVISSMVEEDDLMEDLFWSVVWLYLIMLAGILLINRIVLRKLWKPFYEILNQLKNFRLDKTPKTTEVKTNITEFQALKAAVDDLMTHSLATYAHQKQFTENAAHELQTPLAIAAGKLELLLEKDSINETLATDIGQVLQMIERLIRLNKSLLLLSKIENRQFSGNETVSINQTVRQCLEEMEDFISYKNVKISVLESAQIEVNMDPSLAAALLSNLIRNAVFHNQPNGSVIIEMNASSLKISNTGDAGPLDAEKIFNRFYKHTTTHTSTGLGLAIAKAICNLYDFVLSYHFDNKHCFEISFNKHR